MKTEHRFKLAIGILSGLLITSVAALMFLLYQNYWWKRTMDSMAGEAGAMQAKSTFRRGRLVLWVIEGENENIRSSGRKDGPFEIMIDEYHSYMPGPWQYAQKRKNEAHNEHMRYMYEHPEVFKNFGRDAELSSSNAPSIKKAD